MNDSPSPAAMPGAQPPERVFDLKTGEDITAKFLREPPAERGPSAAPLPTAPRTGPLYGMQYLRLQALRAAVELHKDRPSMGTRAVIETADQFATFIRSGKTTKES